MYLSEILMSDTDYFSYINMIYVSDKVIDINMIYVSDIVIDINMIYVSDIVIILT